ncbi:MAG TPA: ABC transporter substrate-binding protein [Solirubrobacteraceae bacterium]|jgi:branched-chain amino acid transport system substrate-binding protein|nr:ABC transporter substrate-binding protein [Solirubrobacteraceae bacterium]
MWGSRSEGRSRRALLTGVIAAVLALAAAGCGSSSNSSSAGAAGSSGGSGGGSSMTIADVAPFTGTDGALGPTYLVSCDAATTAINSAGGVLGHHLKCKAVDTRGDPADAVPAVHQLYASGSPSLIIGCTSDEAASVVPIFGSNKTVSFCMTGQSEFDHVKFPYFYRLVPPDLSESYAMTAIAQKKGYKRIALAFGNDIGSQTFVGPAIAGIKRAGMSLVANETLDLNATTFRTEAAKIVSAKPDAIMTEALGPTEASFMSEVKQLNGGKMIPVIGTSATISPDWYKSVAAAVGAGTLASNFSADNLVTETNGPAYQAFSKAMLAEKGKVGSTGNFATYLTAPGAVHLYDGINLAALAMTAAHSTSPSAFMPYILKIGDGVTGATVVHSFADGAAALKAGKQIRYEGPGGPTSFDAYHDSAGLFQVDTYSPSGAVNVAGNLSVSELRALGL